MTPSEIVQELGRMQSSSRQSPTAEDEDGRTVDYGDEDHEEMDGIEIGEGLMALPYDDNEVALSSSERSSNMMLPRGTDQISSTMDESSRDGSDEDSQAFVTTDGSYGRSGGGRKKMVLGLILATFATLALFIGLGFGVGYAIPTGANNEEDGATISSFNNAALTEPTTEWPTYSPTEEPTPSPTLPAAGMVSNDFQSEDDGNVRRRHAVGHDEGHAPSLLLREQGVPLRQIKR